MLTDCSWCTRKETVCDGIDILQKITEFPMSDLIERVVVDSDASNIEVFKRCCIKSKQLLTFLIVFLRNKLLFDVCLT